MRWQRFLRRIQHWSLAGPQFDGSRLRPPTELFRHRNARGRHIAGFRRLLSVGPWTLYVARYAPGNVEDPP